MAEAGAMKQRRIALAVVAGAGIAIVVLLLSLDLHPSWARSDMSLPESHDAERVSSSSTKPFYLQGKYEL